MSPKRHHARLLFHSGIDVGQQTSLVSINAGVPETIKFTTFHSNLFLDLESISSIKRFDLRETLAEIADVASTSALLASHKAWVSSIVYQIFNSNNLFPFSGVTLLHKY